MALRGGEADAIGFTLVRLVAGAVTLITISYLFGRETKTQGRGNWISAFFLFAYAICFSLAYLALNAGTGALILFGSVQFTMIVVRTVPRRAAGTLEWLGLALAVGGLVYLVFPGLASPPLYSSLLMAAAGVAWGVYTLRGKGGDPLAATTGNFIWSVPIIILASIPFLFADPSFEPRVLCSLFFRVPSPPASATPSGTPPSNITPRPVPPFYNFPFL